MQIQRTKNFEKQYKKLPKKIQDHFDERLLLLLDDPSNPLLKVHPLRAERIGMTSLNVDANYRALFTWEMDRIIFYEIGTHSQLYS